jgi:PAS domain S-box-containing protein
MAAGYDPHPALLEPLPLFETALDAVVAMRPDGTIAEWNHVAERTFGWTRAEAVGRLMADLIVPAQHRAAHIAGIARYNATGEASVLNQRLEITALDRAEREFPVELSITLAEANGERLFVGFLRDITERKESEKLLIRRAREAELLFEISRFAAESETMEPVLERTLEAICELTGWPVGHALIASSEDPAELISSDVWVGERSKNSEKLQEVTRSIRFTAGVGLPGLILKTGEPAWMSDTQSESAFVRKGLGFGAAFAFPLKSSGRILAVLEFFTVAKTPPDPELLLTVRTLGEQVGRVAERRWAELARAKAEAQASSIEAGYKRIFEQTSDLVFTTALDQVITDCNPAAADALGVARSDVLGRSIADFVSEEDLELTRRMLRQKIEQGGTTRYELRVRNAHGQQLFWEMNSGLTYDEDQQPIGIHVLARDITARKRWDHHQRLLVAELNHRVKNTLSIVQSLAHQSFTPGNPPTEAIAAYEGRLTALAAAHNLLTRENWEAASIDEVIRAAVSPFCRAGRCHVEGPIVRIPPQAAVSLALAIHELATNAAKYGALSNRRGEIDIHWETDARELHLVWSERGGPPVEQPTRSGFGTRLISRVLAADLEGTVEVEFRREGLVCRVHGTVPEVQSG